MMPKSLILLASLATASLLSAQTWSNPYTTMGLQQPPSTPQPQYRQSQAAPSLSLPQPSISQPAGQQEQPREFGNPALSLMIPPAMTSRDLNLKESRDKEMMLPLRLAGYELRVMDITKQVNFDINGMPVKADVPIFIYMPREPRSIEKSTRELRRLYNDLILVYDNEEVDKPQIRDMLERLDTVIDRFDALNASITQRTSAVEE